MKEEKTLIIAGCSKLKKDYETKAIDLYWGQIFKSIKKYIEINDYELYILSAKHGLIKKDEIIAPYNQTIKTKKDIKELKEKILKNDLLKTIEDYDRIELLMGNSYQEALTKAIIESNINMNMNVFGIEKKNGIFDYKKNIKKLLNGDKTVLYTIQFN